MGTPYKVVYKMNNTETTDDDTVNFSLLFQGVLMLGWIMFSVPAVFWGGILLQR